MVKSVIKLGECFRIPLPDAHWAYCQFIFRSPSLGFLIRVFDVVTREPLSSVDNLESARQMFPPVFVGLLASVRSGRWQKIGSMALKKFVFPKFRQTMGTKPGVYSDWRIWDGTQTVTVGKLPEHMRGLELKQVWGDEGLEERIVAGTYRGDVMF